MSMLSIALFSTLVIFTASIFYFVYRTEGDSWRGRQGEAARNAASVVSGFVQRVQDEMIVASIMEPDHLVTDSGELENLLQMNPALLEIVRADANGKVFSSSHKDEQELTNLISITQSEWFLRVKTGQSYLGDIQLSATNKPYLIMAVPTAQGGVVAARVKMDVLWNAVQNIRFGKSGEIIVITLAGNIIAHTNPEFVIAGKTLFGRPELSEIENSPNFEWSGIYTDFHNERVAAVTAPVPGTNWIVITELPLEEAFATSKLAILTLGIEAFIILILVSFIVSRFVRRLIAKPMEELRNGTDRIGQGDLEYRIDLVRNDEIGQLATAFNNMTIHLGEHEQLLTTRTEALAAEVEERKRTERALQEAKNELELRVEERTAKLREINEQLAIELKKRILAVEALRESEIKYQMLVEHIPAAVYIWELGKNGICRYISPQIEHMLGFTVQEWQANPKLFFQQIHPDDRSRALATEESSDASGEMLRSEFRMITRDGQVIWVRDEAVILPATQGQPRMSQGFLYNITDRKQAEAALQESQERYALAVNGANDGLWDWNLKSNEIYYSPRWKTMLGYKENEIGNNPDEWFKRVHPEDQKQVQADLVSHIRGQTPHFESEYRIRHANGSELWVLSRGLVVRDTDNIAYRMAGSQTDITARKLAEERLAYDTLHDPLTGLPNRVLFMDRLENRVERTRRNPNALFAIMFIDLDRFKVVNDSLGHAVGDQLLVTTAQRLLQCLRPEDTISRLSGDEFAILLNEVNDIGDTVRVADRIKGHLVTTTLLGAVERSPTASIGIAMFNKNYTKPEELLRDADIAMYRAKALGGNCHQLFDTTMYASAVALLQLEGELKRAVERKEWLVYYQPIISLANGETVGAEALVRWLHPKRGIVFPQDFIRVAEDTGLILPLGAYVLRAACQQVKAWRDAGRPSFWVSVNISGRQFQDHNLVEKVTKILLEVGLPSDALRLEITETVAIRDMEYTIKIMNDLNELGVRTSLDDFGTGYSSLSYLKRFPLKVLKIDQSFIQDIQVNKNNESLTTAIIAMARSLGLEVVAEGVEREEQLTFLRTQLCDNVQGFLLSHPIPAIDLTRLLNTK